MNLKIDTLLVSLPVNNLTLNCFNYIHYIKCNLNSDSTSLSFACKMYSFVTLKRGVKCQSIEWFSFVSGGEKHLLDILHSCKVC